jgi:hypothetical protein
MNERSRYVTHVPLVHFFLYIIRYKEQKQLAGRSSTFNIDELKKTATSVVNNAASEVKSITN